MTSTNTLIVGGILIGLYLFRDKIGEAFNPVSSQNVANRAAESLYQSLTGSTGTPGGDLATIVYSKADANSIAVLQDYFTKQGYTDDTIAKARSMGWSDSDINAAVYFMRKTDW